MAYNISFGSGIGHELHLGYQRYIDAEDLVRSSNGWGLISVPGGRTNLAGTPIFYTARIQQQTAGAAAGIPIRVSLDQLRGQRHDPVEGLVVQPRRAREPRHALRPGSPGGQLDALWVSARARQQVPSVQIPFSKMIQPRIGATWAYRRERHRLWELCQVHPAASSLPRAA